LSVHVCVANFLEVGPGLNWLQKIHFDVSENWRVHTKFN